MPGEFRAIDISNMPELARIAEEVRSTNEPYVLWRAGEEVAILMPARLAGKRRRRVKRVPTEAYYEAFRSAAGSWMDVDTDKFLAEIYESRRSSSRPPVEL